MSVFPADDRNLPAVIDHAWESHIANGLPLVYPPSFADFLRGWGVYIMAVAKQHWMMALAPTALAFTLAEVVGLVIYFNSEAADKATLKTRLEFIEKAQLSEVVRLDALDRITQRMFVIDDRQDRLSKQIEGVEGRVMGVARQQEQLMQMLLDRFPKRELNERR